MFSGQKVALVHTCWMHSHMVETLRLPLLGCSTGLFSSNVRGENAYGSTHTLPCLWSCMCLGALAKNQGTKVQPLQMEVLSTL